MRRNEEGRVVSMGDFIDRRTARLAKIQESQSEPIVIPEFVSNALEENRHRERRLGMRVVERVIDSSDIPSSDKID